MIDRENNSFLAKWWWQVDRFALGLIATLIVLGLVILLSSSPDVAERLNKGSFYFVKRQIIYLIVALGAGFFLSSLHKDYLKPLCVIGFLGFIAMLILVKFIGFEYNGARRWLSIFGFSLQPSEIAKPLFAITTAYILSNTQLNFSDKKRFFISAALTGFVATLIVTQPDFGMTLLYGMIWAVQIFVFGINYIYILGLALIAILGATSAYFILPHVKRRIDVFLDPSAGDNYQNTKSIEAFMSGGLFGKGPGEGVVKERLPDAHTDFIFAVAAEEFGVIFCFILLIIFFIIAFRIFKRLQKSEDKFKLLALSGLTAQLLLQTIINISVSLSLLPNTGMTLPFISYGGSATISIAINLGLILALTKKKIVYSTKW